VSDGAASRRRFNPAAWLLILLPASSVVAGLATVVLAFRVFDGVVVDDYYARGKAINRVLARDRAAAARALEAVVETDAATGRIEVRLVAAVGPLPERVDLSFLHSTLGGRDRRVALAHAADGAYRGRIESLARGRYHVQLETADWRLVGELAAPVESRCRLAPAL
jgi:hypothetical protein